MKTVISVVAGDYLQTFQASNEHENFLLRNCFSSTCMSDLSPSSATNRGINHVLNNANVASVHQTEVIDSREFGSNGRQWICLPPTALGWEKLEFATGFQFQPSM